MKLILNPINLILYKFIHYVLILQRLHSHSRPCRGSRRCLRSPGLSERLACRRTHGRRLQSDLRLLEKGCKCRCALSLSTCPLMRSGPSGRFVKTWPRMRQQGLMELKYRKGSILSGKVPNDLVIFMLLKKVNLLFTKPS